MMPRPSTAQSRRRRVRMYLGLIGRRFPYNNIVATRLRISRIRYRIGLDVDEILVAVGQIDRDGGNFIEQNQRRARRAFRDVKR